MDQLSDGVRTYELQNTGTEYGLMSGSSFQGKPEDVWWQNYPRLRKLKVGAMSTGRDVDFRVVGVARPR